VKKILLVATLIVATTYSTAQTSYWTKTNVQSLAKSADVNQQLASKADAYEVDIDAIKTQLTNAVDRFDGGAAIDINFPTGDDGFETFAVYKSGAMSTGLEAKFPNIRSYYGFSTTNSLNKVYFTITPSGLHGVLRGDRIRYLNPVSKSLNKTVFLYKREDLDSQDREQFECHTPDELMDSNLTLEQDSFNKAFEDRIFHTYRMAIAATSEYTAYHDDGDDTNGNAFADALAGIVITLTRVNSVFENEVSVRFELVTNNDRLIYSNGRNNQGNLENYDNYDAGQMIGANTGNINSIIGSGAYDIGHIFSTGGGGLASSDRCSTNGKARGVTGIVTPEFDPFDVDYVSHEIGHQFGASHTFYNGCFGGRPSSAPYESGSGSTIMGYAGICAPNVQDNSDAYFHLISLFQMQGQIDSDTCDNQFSLGSLNVTAPNSISSGNKTIPKSTPFKLTGQSSQNADANDVYTYNWEQLDTGDAADTGATQPPLANNPSGPMFRSKFATTNPERYFPNISDLAAGIDPTWETLPSAERDLRFFCTIRDNNVYGGQTSFAGLTLSVGAQGPLTVANPTNTIWYEGGEQSISWNVNGTNATAYAPNVNIKLSIDGGLTYPVTLKANTPNDGATTVTVPENVVTTTARIMVEAVDNYFFNINSVDFEIKSGSFELVIADDLVSSCAPDDAILNFNYDAAPGFNETIILTTQGLPSAAVVSFDQNNFSGDQTVGLTVSETQNITPGSYDFQLIATTTSQVIQKELTLKIFDNNVGDVVMTAPVNGAANQVATPLLIWQDLPSASAYVVQVATDSQMNNIVETSNVSNATQYQTTSLQPGQIYYWSIQPNNSCANGEASSIYVFQTAQQVTRTYDQETYFNDNNAVNNQWAANSNNAISAKVTITDDIEITDVSFYMRASHNDTGDLKMQFRAPSGTFSEVYNRECADGRNFDVTITDNATDAFGCASTYRGALTGNKLPGQSFQRFHGQSALGVWELLATDRVNNGIGGTFNEFSVTVAGRLQYVNDFDQVIAPIAANFNQSITIDNLSLNTSQAGATATDLVYIVNKLPNYGKLVLNGTELALGQTFTQADINNNLVTYNHDARDLIYQDHAELSVLGINNTLSDNIELPINISQPVLIYDNAWSPFEPALDTGDLLARVRNGSVTIDQDVALGTVRVLAGASMIVDADMTVAGNINVTGNLQSTTTSNIIIASDRVQRIQGTGTIDIQNLVVNNTVGLNIDSPTNLYKLLTPNNSRIVTNGNLTFKSDVSGTAQLADASAANITGDVVVEQYIPGKRAFRFMASSVNSTGSIYDNWQEGGSTAAGLGTHITGSTDGSNGFDATSTGNPSLFQFDNDNYSWSAVANTDVTKLEIGSAYRLLVRGDRQIDLSSNDPQASATTLRATGTLQTGDLSLSYQTADQEFALLANPYQAAIDSKQLLDASSTTGISKSFVYIWDPQLNQRGGYVTLDMSTITGEPTPSSSDANKFIQAGQSFFVKTTGVSSLQYTEGLKNVGVPQTNTFGTNTTSNQIKVTLGTTASPAMDQFKIVFDNAYSNDVEDNDAAKFYNQDETLAVKTNDRLLSIEKRALPEAQEAISIFMDQLRHTNYQINVELEGLPNTLAYLVDNYAGTRQPLDNSNNSYQFDLDGTDASKASNRFTIEFEKSTLSSNTIENESTWKMYPNPTKDGVVYLENQSARGKKMTLSINNLLGQQVFEDNVDFNGLHTINLGDGLTTGVYLVTVTIGDNKSTRRLVIE
jgi:subtilisin-like proprotein convertase family protein